MQPEDGFSGIAGNDLVSLLNPEQAGEGAETACSYGKTVCVVFWGTSINSFLKGIPFIHV